MTLLRRIVQRLTGVSVPPPSPSPPAAAPEVDASRRRSRGGRGRGRGNGQQPPANGPRRIEAARPPSRPRRYSLEQPLPEDVAFRPADEGGDLSIVPPRRRRGAAQRGIQRVLSAELTHYVTRGGDNGAPAVSVTSVELSEAPAPDSEAPAERKRRRRGRRGGRGRRRPGENGAQGATP